MATPFDRDVFLKQLARAEKYLLNKQATFLGEQLKKVASIGSIRNWLNDVDGEETKGYSKAGFAATMPEVPDFELLDRVLLYRDILNNAGLTSDTQKSIKDYEGHYSLILPSALASEESCVKIVVLKAFIRPNFFGFVFKYNSQGPAKRISSICDGMLFRRGGRFYMLGTAQETTLMAHFKAEHYPKQHPLLGQMTLEVIPTKTFLDTKFALVRYEVESHEDMIDAAREYLN